MQLGTTLPFLEARALCGLLSLSVRCPSPEKGGHPPTDTTPQPSTALQRQAALLPAIRERGVRLLCRVAFTKVIKRRECFAELVHRRVGSRDVVARIGPPLVEPHAFRGFLSPALWFSQLRVESLIWRSFRAATRAGEGRFGENGNQFRMVSARRCWRLPHAVVVPIWPLSDFLRFSSAVAGMPLWDLLMQHGSGLVTETWRRHGCGIELPHVSAHSHVIDPDRLTHVSVANYFSLIAKNAAEAHDMTSEVADAFFKRNT